MADRFLLVTSQPEAFAGLSAAIDRFGGEVLVVENPEKALRAGRTGYFGGLLLDFALETRKGKARIGLELSSRLAVPLAYVVTDEVSRILAVARHVPVIAPPFSVRAIAESFGLEEPEIDEPPPSWIQSSQALSESLGQVNEGRQDVESLAARLSLSFLSLTGGEIKEGIREALRITAHFFQADRGFILHYAKDPMYFDEKGCEWKAEGVGSFISAILGEPVSKIPWLNAEVSAGKTVFLDKLGDLPPSGKNEKALFKVLEIHGILAAPLIGREHQWGMLAFTTSRKPKAWQERDLAALEIARLIFANALDRKYSEEALRESQERYELAVMGSNDAIWDWNIETNEYYLSPRWRSLLGYEDEESSLPVEEWSRHIHSDDLARVLKSIQEHLAGKTPYYENQYRISHKDGSFRWILDRGVALRDAQGKPYRMAGSLTDITRRKLAESALRQSEERYRTLIQGVGCLIVGLTPDGKILEFNQEAEKVLGCDRLEAMGGEFSRMFLEESDRTRFSEAFTRALAGEPIRNFEIPGISRRGEKRIFLWNISAFKDSGQATPIVIASGLDITNRHQDVEKRFHDQERYRTFLEQASDGIFLSDSEGKFIEVNNRVAEMLGYSREELHRMTFPDLVPAEDWNYTPLRWRDLLAGKTVLAERRLLQKGGKTLTVEINSRLMADGALLSIVRDISERKRFDDELRSREERYRNMFEKNRAVQLLIDPGTGKIVDANPSACEFYGYPREQMKSKTILDFNTAPPEQVMREIKAAAREQRNTFQLQHRLSSGEARSVEIHTSPVFQGDRKLLFSIVFDVTERVQSVRALQENEARLRMVIENIPLILFVLDPQGVITFSEGHGLESLQETASNLVGKSVFDLSSIPNHGKQELRKVLSGKTTHFFSEYKDRFLDIWIRPVFDDRGNLTHAIGISVDITERQRMEEDLRRSEERFNLAVRGSMDAIWDWDVVSWKIYFSPRWMEILGEAPQEVLWAVDRWSDRVHPEDLGRVLENIQEKLQGKGSFFEVHYRVRNKKGKYIWVLDRGVVLRHEDGSAYRMAGSLTDITPQKVTEEALGKQKEFLRTVIDLDPNLIFAKDEKGRFTLANQAVAELFGTTPAKLIGKTEFDFHPEPGEVEQGRQNDLEVLATGVPKIIPEEPLTTAAGETRWVRTVKVPLQVPGETRTQVLCVSSDITRQKLAKEALAQSEQSFRVLADTINTALFIHRGGKFLYVNQKAMELTGYSHDELMDLNFWEIVHPEFREEIRARGTKRFNGEKPPPQYEVKILRKDGQELWIDMNATLMDYQGQEAILGTAYNITQRKEAEEALIQSEERNRKLVDRIPDAVLVHSEGRIVFVNPATVNLYAAKSAGQFIGMDVMDLVHPDYRDIVIKRIHRTQLQLEEIPALEQKIVRFDGKEVDVEVLGLPFEYGGKPATQVIMRDITLRKQAQITLQDSETRLRLILQGLGEGLIITDMEDRIVHVNTQITALTGYKEEEMMGEVAYRLLLPPDRWYLMSEKLQGRLKGGSEVYRIELRRKNGSTFWAQIHATPYRDVDGNVIGTLGAFSDISERKLVEESLVELANQRKQLVKAAQSLLSSLDLEAIGNQTVENLQGILEFTTCGLYWLDDSQQILRPHIFSHDSKMERGDVWPFSVGDGILGEVIRKGKGRVLNHQKLAQEEAGLLGDGFLGDNLMIIPIGAQEKTLGLFTVSRDGRRPFTDEEFELVQLYVSHASFAFENALLFERLRVSEEKYRAIFEETKDCLFVSSPSGTFNEINPAGIELLGYGSREEVFALDIARDVYANPRDYEIFKREVLQKGFVRDLEVILRRKDDSKIIARQTATVIRDENGEVLGYRGILRDITNQKQSEELMQEIALGVSGATGEEFFRSLVWHLTKALRVDFAFVGQLDPENPDRMTTVVFWEDGRFGENLSIDLANTPCQRVVRRGMCVFPSSIQEIFPDDDLLKRWEMQSYLGTPLFDSNGTTIGILAVLDKKPMTNIPIARSLLQIFGVRVAAELERKQIEERIWHLAYYDTLTGLPNRVLFNDRLKVEIAKAQRDNRMLAVLFLDLDRFKNINDTLGHSIGDDLLQSVAARLENVLRAGDTISRLGGDEFTILLPQIAKAEDAAKIAQKILNKFRPPFSIQGHELHVSTSIGIAIYPHDGMEASVILKNADVALYRAKDHGRNTYRMYTPAMNASAFELLALENSLRYAPLRGEFEVFYQPKLELSTGNIIGVEALLRWNHPEMGLLSPEQFIPLAEETGLVITIGEWVLRRACTQAREWQEEGHGTIPVAVNLSARQFQHTNLLEMVSTIIEETGLDPSCLEFEVTESIAMDHGERTMQVLRSLRDKGITLSLDDFGTGYSSLSHLKRLPIQTIKIDQSFIRDCTINPDDAAIVRAIISMAQSLKLKVIAEGVETEAQVEFLTALKCDSIQGFIFSRPIPSCEFTKLLTRMPGLAFWGRG